MAKKSKSAKKRKSGTSKSFFTKLKKKLGWVYFLFAGIYYLFYYLGFSVYWIVKGIILGAIWFVRLFYKATDKTTKYVEKKKIEKQRSEVPAEYQKFNLIHHDSGSFDKFEKKVSKNDSTIGIILGARGSGKTAIAVKLLENIYAKTKKKCFALGFKEEDMPIWIDVVESINELKNNSFVLIDEGGILFSSRRSMAEPNKLLSELMLIARHKSISIIFISQNSANLEINAIRQADYLVLKTSSLLQKDFERKKIKEIYEDVGDRFKKYKGVKGITYIYSDEFAGFVDNPLPSFWSKKISRAFRKEDE
ncbi:hypothetical protein HN695_04905 [Candidatus Woesearchaeota archaeon]|jgi:hypothetical protein|nr:hypothetical protein [Candidatus Woesearchaeota archaeon]MBT5272063.1 hypothetical protein [Candidatus Woesearchaeota archaeon]MBT6041813.1 hypothetical protein [Candidatus Woesearchaeota archaeon]MBT6336812.1 hypothetical protein [Candidatus Woesearchaeota archaeon]MBT7927653.1 hypothetical protein [Candidatus Woesearchaeota archaeon]